MPAAPEARRYAFVFVGHGGELERKALLLAASLKRFVAAPHQIVFCEPSSRSCEALSDGARDLLREWQVPIATILNPVDEDYPIAHKIACLGVATDAEKLVFLDSDILCLREFVPDCRFDAAFCAKPADLQTFTRDPAAWQQAYRVAEVAMPTLQFPTTVSGEYGLPYFNAGVIAVDAGTGLDVEWARCCRAVRAGLPLRNRGRSADQISLAIAVQHLQLRYQSLDEGYNYPAHLKQLNRQRLPVFFHYHDAPVISREPAARMLIRSLTDEHPRLRSILAASDEWRPLLEEPAQQSSPGKNFAGSPGTPVNRKRNDSRPDLIITGIARSGTSYLCNLLHRYSNCVIINEPEEIFGPLVAAGLPWDIPLYYHRLRAAILSGASIKNKLHDGQIIEDTLGGDVRSEYLPRVENSDFILGTKNTMTYLARLDALRRVMPNARVIACVRNPFETIASWKGSFPHLANADLRKVSVGQPDDPWLSARNRVEVERILQTADVAQRRAMWWRYAAERILEQGQSVTLVRYQELLAEPARVVDQILDGFDKGVLREPITPSAPRPPRALLDAADEQAIGTICAQAAYELGV